MELYLIPPSEWKCVGGEQKSMHRTFDFELPVSFAVDPTEKDLKCTGKRYEEAVQLNRSLSFSPVMKSIERYTGVFYTALGYASMDQKQKWCIDNYVLIVSWLFGLLKPEDIIPNYKLPIETRWLRAYRYPVLTEKLCVYCMNHGVTEIIDLLPMSYQKAIDRKKTQQAWIIRTLPKIETSWISHWIKKLRGERLRKELMHKIKK